MCLRYNDGSNPAEEIRFLEFYVILAEARFNFYRSNGIAPIMNSCI